MKEDSFPELFSAVVKCIVVVIMLPSLLILMAIEKLLDMGKNSS